MVFREPPSSGAALAADADHFALSCLYAKSTPIYISQHVSIPTLHRSTYVIPGDIGETTVSLKPELKCYICGRYLPAAEQLTLARARAFIAKNNRTEWRFGRGRNRAVHKFLIFIQQLFFSWIGLFLLVAFNGVHARGIPNSPGGETSRVPIPIGRQTGWNEGMTCLWEF